MRNLAEAHEALTHRRTGKMMLSRWLSHNARLHYATERVAVLTIYTVPSVFYTKNGITIDVQGMHMRTPWREIDRFTIAKPVTHNRLRYLRTSMGDVLYEPRTKLNSDGIIVNPMTPLRQAAISDAARTGIENFRSYARRAVECWDSESMAFCSRCDSESGAWEYHIEDTDHLLSHVERGEHLLPGYWGTQAELLASEAFGDELLRRVYRSFAGFLIHYALPQYVERRDPRNYFKFHADPRNRRPRLERTLNL